MEVVSIRDVARKTWALLSNDPKVSLAYLLIFMTAIAGVEIFDRIFSEEANWFYGASLALSVLLVILSLASSLSLQNYAITSSRETPSFIPAMPFYSLFRYLLACIAINIIVTLSGFVCILPMTIMEVTGFGQGNGILMFGFTMLTALFAILGTTIPFVRLCLIVPAAAVGDEYTFAETWKTTKGYTLKLLGVGFILALPQMLLALYGSLVYPSVETNPSVLYIAVDTVISTVMLLISFSFLALLYEDLQLAYAANSAMEQDSDELEL